MELWNNERSKWFIIMTLVLALGTFGTVAPVHIHADDWQEEVEEADKEDLKYTKEITKGIIEVLEKNREEELEFEEALVLVNQMSKAEAMDHYLESYEKKVEPKKIRETVKQIYGIDLEEISQLDAGKQVSTFEDFIIEGVKASLDEDEIDEPLDEYILSLSKVEIMDLYFESYNGEMDGGTIRNIINEIFGTNLTGISALEGTGVSIFSKNQWITQYDYDLFVVETGIDDVDVWIYPTTYFMNQTGMTELPVDLQHALQDIGYYYSEDKDTLYFSDPGGKSVPDRFKGQTLGILVGFIQNNYAELLVSNSSSQYDDEDHYEEDEDEEENEEDEDEDEDDD
ncbi:hypothetical protein [Halobacillus yeomjeoni]|uniref:Uncharacterized protein n=1 Tax=Halobacillus yeomjeoni TaxID=311194 RepID=A0A931HW91_9BACI|nr:hypothetical protein [Halobacillus yeomjeoni]MBH0230306.1 hypothetical protein [Halobacillus yeomjeoni]